MKEYRAVHKQIRALLIIACILIAILLALVLFLKTWPAFGGRASEADMEDYEERAANYSDGVFHNTEPFQIMAEETADDDNIMSHKGMEPEDSIPSGQPELDSGEMSGQVQVTWFGHSSLLLQTDGLNILIDPVFSERSSPVSFAGGRRFSRPSITAEELPDIDVIVLSHDHYDHMDYRTLKDMDSKVSRYVVPLGIENHLERWGIAPGKITNMAWWEEIQVQELTIGCTPARHYSGRSIDDRNAALWASWVFKTESVQIFESGDTGYGTHFQAIHEKYGDFDFVMLDCAQYDKRWPDVHMFPEESIQAATELGAKAAMPIHWGAFTLAEHPWDDPAERFVNAGEERGLPVVTPMIGETVKLDNAENYDKRWWREVN